jgi:RHS repeat-associated protein
VDEEGIQGFALHVSRWYRPGWGRYTQADPVGLSRDRNLYGYVAENPLVYVDRLGLVRWKCDYHFATANTPGFGLGFGALGISCVSECACGKTVDASLSVAMGGGSAGLPWLPGGSTNSSITLTDSNACPTADCLSGLTTLTSGSFVPGAGISYTVLNLGCAAGRSELTGSSLLSFGLDFGVDNYAGYGFLTGNKESACCPMQAER